MEDEKFDCIIVGGGIAGLSAALTLARANMKFLLIERGEFSGAKNVSGGVLWGTQLAELVPNYWEEDDIGFERYIKHRRLSFLDHDTSFSIDFKSEHFEEPPYKGVIVLRSKFDNWFAGKVQDAIEQSDYADESFLANDILVEEVLKENGKVIGIRSGEEKFYSDCVIIAEGVNNLLTRQIGLQTEYVPADYVATGVKEIIRIDQKVLENRFQLDGLSGMSNEFIGLGATLGVEGGGFLYTNRDSLSIGLVVGLKDLREKGGNNELSKAVNRRREEAGKPLKAQDKSMNIYDILSEFKKHPAVKDMIKGGETVEYSAHVVSTGDMQVMPSEIYADGVMIAGEAANLLMNSGKAIQGMDYAMKSGVLAAQTAVDAKKKKDYSAASLKNYRTLLEKSYVMKDMRQFQSAVHFLHTPAMFNTIPNLVCDFGRQFFTIDNTPTDKTSKMLKNSIKKYSSYSELLKIGIKGARSL
ncbi:MAG TPA: FAD-dependent oxidoreductase [Balneolales bacterium]|nr:FAD-dependent oxidoreductase [Balneolales bacterium]